MTLLFFCIMPFSFAALTDGLIGSWNISDGTGAIIAPNIGTSGYLMGTSTWVNNYLNQSNKAVSLISTTRVFNANTSASYPFAGTGDLAASWWANYTDKTSWANGYYVFTVTIPGSGEIIAVTTGSATTFKLYNGSAQGATAYTVPGGFNNYIIVRTGGYMQLYVNGTLVINDSLGAASVSSTKLNVAVGRLTTIPNPAVNYLANVNVYNRSLSAAEITSLSTPNTNSYYPFTTAATINNFTITTTDFYTNNSINNFSAQLNGVTYSTTNGTIVTNLLSNATSLYQINVSSTQNGGYFNKTYNSVNLSSALAATLAQSSVTFSAKDIITNATISGATFNTTLLTNGTHYFNAASYNVSAVASGYYTQTIQYNATALSTATYTYYLTPTYTLNLSSNTYGTAPRLLRYSADVTNAQYSYTITKTSTDGTLQFNLTPSILYNITIYAFQTNESHLNYTIQNYNISTNLTVNYTVLNLTAKDYLSTATLGNITQTVSSSNVSGAVAQRTNTANPAAFFIYPSLNYSLSTFAPGYNTLYYSLPNFSTGVYNYVANLTANNSVYFSFLDANTLNPLFVNVTATLINGGTTYNCTGAAGNCLIQNITPNNYTVVITATSYNTLSGSVSVGNNTYQAYIAYMNSPSPLNTIFTITDQQTLEPIAGAVVSVESRTPANPIYSFITALYSDVVGSALLNYNASLYYRITVTATGYDANTFELKPIIYTAYEVRLKQNITINVTDPYQSLSIQRTPNSVNNNQTANFTYFISAPSGNLIYYNYTIFTSYNNSILLQGTGINAYGGLLNTSFFVSTNLLNATVYMATSYRLSNGYISSFLTAIPVQGVAVDSTSSGAANNRFNIPLFDRLLIVTIIVILAAGMAFYFAGVMPGGAMAIFVLSYFVATGFMPYWAGIPSVIVLMFLIMRPNQ